MTTNTMLGHIIKLKSLVRRAIREGSIRHNPFPEYVQDSQEHRYRHLSVEELERVMNTRIIPPKTCFVRDMFVFSCFTGLAYADVRSLSIANLHTAPDGNLWIDIPRKKTGVESHIRLLDIPAAIIEKYRPERKSDRLFNMPVHCVVTWHMRKLEKLCGISHLHYHMARHTFATEICLNNGVPMETLSRMMGHSTMRSTQIYGEITGRKVKKDMQKLSERTAGKYHMG
jgi:site-specific recombinase XerD